MRRRLVILAALTSTGFLIASCGSDPVPAADAASSDGGEDAVTTDAERDLTDAALADTPNPRDSSPQDQGVDQGPAPTSPGLLYVTVGSENRLAVLEVTAEGSLSEREDWRLDLGGTTGPLGRSPSRLYVGVQDRGVITVALGADGQPSILGVTETPDPVYVSTANEGAVLITAFYGGGRVSSYNSGGSLPYSELDSEATGDQPHAAFVWEGHVYVPHRNGQFVSWSEIQDDGTFGSWSQTEGEPGGGPRHIDFHPTLARAYVLNEFASSISAFSVTDGALARLGSAESALPADFAGSNTGADVHVHPSGRYLYSSNRGHDSIAVFDIADDGALSFRTAVPTEARPREFELSPDGRLLFALGQDSGAVQSYRIGVDGSLEPADRIELGDDLLWAVFSPHE